MRLARLLRQHADPDSGLSQSLLSALTSINRVGPVTLGQLASIERVQPPSMTRIIDQLEARGLVVREIDEADRRVARVRLLPPADTLIAELRTRKTEYLASRLADLTTAELDALEAALPALEHLAGVSQ
jgi:DNA-binding MarR family transcriptional regulator